MSPRYPSYTGYAFGIGTTDANGKCRFIFLPDAMALEKEKGAVMIILANEMELGLTEHFLISTATVVDEFTIKLVMANNYDYFYGKLPTSSNNYFNMYFQHRVKKKYSRTYVVKDENGIPIPNASLEYIDSDYNDVRYWNKNSGMLGQTDENGILKLPMRAYPYFYRKSISLMQVTQLNGKITYHNIDETPDDNIEVKIKVDNTVLSYTRELHLYNEAWLIN